MIVEIVSLDFVVRLFDAEREQDVAVCVRSSSARAG